MARTRVRFGRVVLLAGALAGVVATAGGGGDVEPPMAAASFQRYVVQPGDTLWRIARRQVGPRGDPRPMIEDIRQANELSTAALRPGVRLLMP